MSFLAATANDYTQAGATSTSIATGNGADPSTSAIEHRLDDAGAVQPGLLHRFRWRAEEHQQHQPRCQPGDDRYRRQHGEVRRGAVRRGAANVELQQTFINNLASTLTNRRWQHGGRGHDGRIRQLSALQVQQQLGTQALSIANQAPQMLLKL